MSKPRARIAAGGAPPAVFVDDARRRRAARQPRRAHRAGRAKAAGGPRRWQIQPIRRLRPWQFPRRRRAAGTRSGTTRRRAATRGTITRPLCVTTTFCTMASPRPVPRERVVKNGWKTAVARRLGDAGAVVVHRDAAASRSSVDLPVDRDRRRDAGAPRTPRRRCESGCRTPGAAAPRRPRSRRTRRRTSTVGPAAARARSSSAARRTTALEVDRREHHLLGPREVEEVRHHLPERLGLLPDAVDVRAVRPAAARRDRSAGCSRGWSPARCGTRARCRRSARRAAPAPPSAAAALRARRRA